MTDLLVPVELDVLLIRNDTQQFVPTLVKSPTDPGGKTTRQPLAPPPLQDGAALRWPGAYLQWALPDGLTRAESVSGSVAFAPLPSRWLVLRLTGDVTAGPRTVDTWLIPEVSATTPTVVPDALDLAAVPVVPVMSPPLTLAGTGDLGWSAYYDNVAGRLGMYDPLTGVTGAVSYLVVGWFAAPGTEPLAAITSPDAFDAYLHQRSWSLPGGPAGSSGLVPTRTICHGAVLGLGWPDPTWPGDGGTLGAEAGGPPAVTDIRVVVAETVAEAAAALSATDNDDPALHRLLEALVAGALPRLADVDGPAQLDTDLHQARFRAVPSRASSETIWEPAIPGQPGDPAAPGGGPNVIEGAVPDGDVPPTDVRLSLAEAVAASRRRAGLPMPRAEPESDALGDDPGSLVDAGRSKPRAFQPYDPLIGLAGAGRSLRHGGDGRFSVDGTLQVRLRDSGLPPGATVRWFGSAGSPVGDAASVLPGSVAPALATLGLPDSIWDLLVEAAALDPSSASDLAASTPTSASPDARARYAWLTQAADMPAASVVGTLPSPVAAFPPTRPWTPLHVEWSLGWRDGAGSAHAFPLGPVDYELPTADALPPTAAEIPVNGRSRLTAAPARVAAGGLLMSLDGVRSAGVLDGDVADRLAARVAAVAGNDRRRALEDTVADQDLLSASLEGFLATLRGTSTDPVVGPPGTPPKDDQRPTNPDSVRAGLLDVKRLRVVDGYGQYVEVVGDPGGGASAPVAVAPGLAVDGAPGTAALVPRFFAPATVLMRYQDASGQRQEASTAISPLCGFVLPSPIDGSLEVFHTDGTALGRLRDDPVAGTVWEEDPGEPASYGRLPSRSIPNRFLGAFVDGLLAADVNAAAEAAANGTTVAQTGLAALRELIDTTRWTVDLTGATGDEHLALLLGHPVAVMRAAVRLDVQDGVHTTAATTSVPVKLGTLAHTQDGLLAYAVADDYTKVHAVDPALGIGTNAPITSPYVDLSPSFDVQPDQPVSLTLLVVPGADVHVTTGLLPQKSMGMRRDWLARGLATLTPSWRYGPLLIDRKVTRIPVAADVHGLWTWQHRTDASTWASDTVVNATPTAVLADDPMHVDHGWVRLQVLPDPGFPGMGVRVTCIRKPIRDAAHRIQGLGGLNGDGSTWSMSLDSAIQMVESGRFQFYVLAGNDRLPLEVGISVSGHKFLRTVANGVPTDNLLTLPECPKGM